MKVPGILAVIGLLPLVGWAEEAVLFRASSLDAGKWGCEGTIVTQQGPYLVIGKASQNVSRVGNAYSRVALPFFSSGEVSINSKGIQNGTHTVQLLCFSGAEMLSSVDLFTDISMGRSRRIKLTDLKLPGGMDSFIPKIWIAGGKGVRAQIAEMTYSIEVPTEGVLLDETFASMEGWEVENLDIQPLSQGVRATLKEGVLSGALLCPGEVPRNSNAIVLLQLSAVTGGSVSIQGVFFDDTGTYLESRDIVSKSGSGWSAGALTESKWPSSAATLRLKVWLAGTSGASANLVRLMVVERR